MTGTASLIGHLMSRGRKLFMKLDDFKLEIDVEHGVVHMNNVFGGNKLLSELSFNPFISNSVIKLYKLLNFSSVSLCFMTLKRRK